MYMRSEVGAAHDRYWQAIRSEMLVRGIRCPETLSDADDLMAMWLSPDLVLSQTCGMPYRLHLHDKVKLVGTPDYGIDGCEPGFYNSVFIVRANDTRRRVDEFSDDIFAFNSIDSQSGYAAPYFHCQALGFWFQRKIATNAHVASAQTVIEGQASIAAIDAVTWRLLENFEPALSALKVLDRTAPTPGLPYISAVAMGENQTFDAVHAAINRLHQHDKSLLQLQGIVSIDKAEYLAVPNPDE